MLNKDPSVFWGKTQPFVPSLSHYSEY